MSETARIWVVMVAVGIGTYFIRYSFLGLVGDRPLPEWLLRALRYVPVAVMPALVAPLVVWPAATEGTPIRRGCCGAGGAGGGGGDAQRDGRGVRGDGGALPGAVAGRLKRQSRSEAVWNPYRIRMGVLRARPTSGRDRLQRINLPMPACGAWSRGRAHPGTAVPPFRVRSRGDGRTGGSRNGARGSRGNRLRRPGRERAKERDPTTGALRRRVDADESEIPVGRLGVQRFRRG